MTLSPVRFTVSLSLSADQVTFVDVKLCMQMELHKLQSGAH